MAGALREQLNSRPSTVVSFPTLKGSIREIASVKSYPIVELTSFDCPPPPPLFYLPLSHYLTTLHPLHSPKTHSTPAEKALATISTISLSINPPGDYQSPCSATPLWVRNLPDGIDEGYLFDLFRPFGPLQSIRFIVQGPRDDLLGTVKVIYLREESARQAKSTMDGTEVEGNRISVVAEITPASPQETVSTPRRTSRMSATAAPFVPRNSPIASPRTRQTCPSLPATPPRRVQEEGFNALWTSPGYRASIPLPDQLNPINGPILPVPGTNLRYSPPRDTFIDPRNLYCQNLERSIDNAALTVIFQGFGQITSAQVITDADNKSRRHGFVSFAHASEAAHALAALNGAIIRGRPMYLRLHEPRQPRKNRLARRFGVGDTSESQSDMTGTSIASQPQTPPRGPASQLTAAALAQQNRSHSSSMNFGLGRHSRVSSIDCGLLSSLTGSARQLYISESLSRKVSVAPAAQNAEKAVSDIVAALATLDLEEQHKILLDRDLLNERVRSAAADGLSTGQLNANFLSPSLRLARSPTLMKADCLPQTPRMGLQPPLV